MLQPRKVVDCGANGLTRPRFQMGFFWPVRSRLEAELSSHSFFITSKTQYGVYKHGAALEATWKGVHGLSDILEWGGGGSVTPPQALGCPAEYVE